jgi:hypothetical protein
MELDLPDVIVREFQPHNAASMHDPVSVPLSRAVHRYLISINKVNKQVADLNLALATEKLQHRDTQLRDVSVLLARTSVAPLMRASIPAVLFAQPDMIELHRTMVAARTLKDTLENWVMVSRDEQ